MVILLLIYVYIDEKSEYKNWGLNIYVKFRDTDNLQLLTGTRQSGGVNINIFIKRSRYIKINECFMVFIF